MKLVHLHEIPGKPGKEPWKISGYIFA